MRLICPNCGAQYEVADDVIPEDGRDVQCSNCAHTWFENRGASDVEDEFSEEVVAPSEATDEENEVWGAEDYAAKPETTPKVAPKRQELDPAIADILREEAAREASARHAEAEAAMQSQTDLGLESAGAVPDQRTVEAQRRMSLLKGEETTAPQVAPSASSRGGLLPDIEEINSSLRPESERGTDDADAEDDTVRKKRGFRSGFFGALLILLLLAAVYILAAEIGERVPAATGALNTYVEMVDAGRLWLDGQMRGLLESMNEGDMASEAVVTPVEAAPEVTTEAPSLEAVSE